MASELTSNGMKASMVAMQPRRDEKGFRQSIDAADRLRRSALTSWGFVVFLKRFESSKEQCALRRFTEQDLRTVLDRRLFPKSDENWDDRLVIAFNFG